MSEQHIAPCTCKGCISACKRNPGWFSPEDAVRALDAGLAKQMMLDYWESPESIYVLSPASVGYKGKIAREMDILGGFGLMFGTGEWTKGQCVMLKNDRCTIHDSGYKPYQCIHMCHNKPMRDMWDNDTARAIIKRWRDETGCEDVAP